SSNGRLLMFDLRADATHTPHMGWEKSDHFTGQPTVASNVVYANNGGALAAFDEITGRPLWTWTAPDGALTGNIMATNTHLFVDTAASIYAIDLSTHQSVWSASGSGPLTLSGGVLYAANGGLLQAFAVVPEPSAIALAAMISMCLGIPRRP